MTILKMLTVGQLAKACDVRTDTVRYYERIGMIGEAARTEAGYRKFSTATAERIRFIKNAQALGFSLGEIKRLVSLANNDSSDCSEVRRFAEAKIVEIDEQMRRMKSLKRELGKLVAGCPNDGVPIDGCAILAHIGSEPKKKPNPQKTLR